MKPVEPLRFAVKGVSVELDPRSFDTVRKGACIGMTGTTHRVNFPPPGLGWDHPIDAVASTTAQAPSVMGGRS